MNLIVRSSQFVSEVLSPISGSLSPLLQEGGRSLPSGPSSTIQAPDPTSRPWVIRCQTVLLHVSNAFGRRRTLTAIFTLNTHVSAKETEQWLHLFELEGKSGKKGNIVKNTERTAFLTQETIYTQSEWNQPLASVREASVSPQGSCPKGREEV